MTKTKGVPFTPVPRQRLVEEWHKQVYPAHKPTSPTLHNVFQTRTPVYFDRDWLIGSAEASCLCHCWPHVQTPFPRNPPSNFNSSNLKASGEHQRMQETCNRECAKVKPAVASAGMASALALRPPGSSPSRAPSPPQADIQNKPCVLLEVKLDSDQSLDGVPASASLEAPRSISDAPTSTAVWIAVSIITSTFIILINKVLMQQYGFNYVYTLTALHFLSGALALRVLALLRVFTPKSIGHFQNSALAVFALGSVAGMNLSLRHNSFSSYQMLKLTVVPAVLLIQRHVPTPRIITSLTIMLIGVAAVTVTDLEFTNLGLLIGVVAVAFTAQFAVWQGSKQHEFQIDARQLLASIAPWQALFAGLLACAFDVPAGLLSHRWQDGELLLVAASCVIAVFVNISSMTTIGKTSPVTFQVIGHGKTCLILACGYLFFPQRNGNSVELAKNVCGVSVALCGVFAYSYYKVTESS